MRESNMQNLIRLYLSEHGVTTWRNNVGALKDITGRLVIYGLCKGSSDIIGIKPVVITQDMIGETIGQFIAIEVKARGKRPTPEQTQFIDVVRKKGGLAGVVYNIEDVDKIIFHKSE